MSNFETYKEGMNQYLHGESTEDKLYGLRQMCYANDQDLQDKCWKNSMDHLDNLMKINALKDVTEILSNSALILGVATFTLSVITVKNRKDKKAMRKRIENLEKFVGYAEETAQEEEENKEKNDAMRSLQSKVWDVAMKAATNPFGK